MPASQSFSADRQSPCRLHTWGTTLVRPGPGPPSRLHGLGPSPLPGFWSEKSPGQGLSFTKKV